MKTIITISQGEITVDKKVLGEYNAHKYIEKYVKDESKKQSLIMCTAWGGTPTELESLTKVQNEILKESKVHGTILNREIGGVIGAHAGPIYGVFIFPKLN